MAAPTSPPTRIRLCGELLVEQDGTRVDGRLPTRQARMLFALLVVRRDRALSRDALADALWAGAPPPSRDASLRVLLTGARQVFGPGSIEGREHVRLIVPADASIDVEEARSALTLAEERLEESEFEAAAAAARRARELTAGELLTGLTAPWIDECRGEIEELSLRALEVEARASLRAGRPSDAERLARRLVERSPYRETAHALLVEALGERGDVAEATLAFDRLRTLLRDELGTTPAPAVIALHERLVAGGRRGLGRIDRGRRAVLPTALARAARRPFVARTHELGRLRRAWATARGGDAQLVVLAGEPGVGKTSLTARFAREVHEEGGTVLLGRCHAEALVPYEPWVEALRQLPDVLLREQAELLGRLVPEAAPAGAAPARDDEPAARHVLFEAVARALFAAAERAPLLLVVDDLHWADEPALLMLRHVTRAAEEASVLILGTYRTTEVPGTKQVVRSLADLAREVPFDRIELDGLGDAEVAELIAALLDRPPSLPLGAALRRDTAGNPLFVGQLLRHLDETGVLVQDGNGLVLSPRDGRPGVPDSVKELVETRLSALRSETAATLRTAAAIGREFRHELLSSVVGRAPKEVLTELEEAGAAGLVEEVAAGRHAFAHAVVQEAIYDGAGPTRRADLHRRVAAILEAAEEGEPAERAHHFLAAGDRAKGLEYSLLSAAHALDQLAYEDAAAHYEQALAALGVDESARRCELLLALGDAQGRAGNAEEAKSSFWAAADLARSVDSTEMLARAAAGYGGRFLWTHALMDPRLVPLLEEGLATQGEAETRLRVQLLSRLAAALRHNPSREYRERIGGEAVRTARRIGDPATLAYALTAAEAALHAPDNADRRRAAGEEIVSLAAGAGDTERLFDGHEIAFWAAWELGDPEGRAHELASMSRVAEELRQPAQLWGLAVAHATLALSQGRFAEAPQLIERAAALGEGVLTWAAAVTRRLQLFLLRREQGGLRGFEREIRDHAEEFPSPLLHGAVLANVLAHVDQTEEAADLLDELTRRDLSNWHVDEEWLLSVCLLAETCAILEDVEPARPLYDLLLPFGGLNAVAVPELALDSASRPLGVLATLLGRFDDAAMHFDEALRMNERMGALPWVARTRKDHARLLSRRGAKGDA